MNSKKKRINKKIKRKSNKKIKRKSNKKQFGGAKVIKPISCKKLNETETKDQKLDTFYKDLFKSLLKQGNENTTQLNNTRLRKTNPATKNNTQNKIPSSELFDIMKDNHILFTELMSRFYNRCVSDTETQTQKIVPIILFKNKYLNRGLSYGYLQRCILYLKICLKYF